jgi:hypothetical protein
MSRSLLLLGALALTSCTQDSSSGWRDLKLQPGDEAKLAEGALPILILQDGKPCPNALFRTEPFYDLAGLIVLRSVVEFGQREYLLSAEEPSVMRADDRGIVWWLPDGEHSVWWLRASHGTRSASFPQTRGLLHEAQSAARSGYAQITLDLLREQTWSVQLSGIGEAPASEVPIFLGTEEDMRVLTRLDWLPDGRVRGFDPVWDPQMWNASERYFIWAGMNRQQADLQPDPLSRSLAFDLSACGSMEFDLFDANGVPVQKPRAVFVEEADADLNWSFPGTAPNSPSVMSRTGHAIMHGVPTGKRWRVGSCLLPDGTLVATEVAGPTHAGERVRIRLSAAETSVPLQGSLLGPDGAPESSAAWTVSVGSADIRFQTRVNGSFHVHVPRFMLEGAQPLSLKNCAAWGEPQRICALTPENVIASDAGTQWIWSEEPFFAMGTVVDEFGKRAPFVGLDDTDSRIGAEADAAGRFRLKLDDDIHDDRLMISAFSPWHLDAETEIVRGDRDALITMTTGARIMGRMAHGKARVPISYQVLRPGASAPEEHYSAYNWSGPNGSFEIGPVPVDATEVRIDYKDRGIAVLKDLRLEAGKVYQLPKPVQLDK